LTFSSQLLLQLVYGQLQLFDCFRNVEQFDDYKYHYYEADDTDDHRKIEQLTYDYRHCCGIHKQARSF
jgi:hypothetical protein